MNFNLGQMQPTLNQFQVLRCLIPTCGPQQSMYQRDFNLNCSSANLDQLSQATNGFMRMCQETVMQGSNPGLMYVNSSANGMVDVDGGWDNDRQVIMLILEDTATHAIYIVSAFTSANFINNGYKEQFANIRFDTVLKLAASWDYNNNPSYDIEETNNILSTATSIVQNQNFGNNTMMEMQRPIDVISNSEIHSNFSNVKSDYPTRILGSGGNDGRTVNSSFSNHANGISNDYLTRTMCAFNTGTTNNQSTTEGANLDQSGNEIQRDLTYNINGATASSLVQETNFNSASIIGHLLNSTVNKRQASIMWRDLVAILPELENPNITDVIPNDGSGNMGTGTHGWQDRYAGQRASEVAIAVISLMLRYGITWADFLLVSSPDAYDMNNMGGGTFTWSDTYGGADNQGNEREGLRVAYQGMPVERIRMHFMNYMQSILIPKLSQGGQIVVEVQASAFKDMIIHLSINGEERYTFQAPTFALGLWSPINTPSVMGADSMAAPMTELLRYMDNQVAGMVPNGMVNNFNNNFTENQDFNSSMNRFQQNGGQQQPQQQPQQQQPQFNYDTPNGNDSTIDVDMFN